AVDDRRDDRRDAEPRPPARGLRQLADRERLLARVLTPAVVRLLGLAREARVMLVQRLDEQTLALPHSLRAVEHRIALGRHALQFVRAVALRLDVACERFRAQLLGIAQRRDRADPRSLPGRQL